MIDVSDHVQGDPKRQDDGLDDDERPTAHHGREPIRDPLTGGELLGIHPVDIDDRLVPMDVPNPLPFPFLDDWRVVVSH